MERTQEYSMFPLVTTEDFQVVLEYTPQLAILHLMRCNLTPSLLKKASNHLDFICEFLENIGGYNVVYCAIDPEDTATDRLARKLGFTYQDTQLGRKIYTYERQY